MSENSVRWHPYPKEKPPKECYYLVTVRYICAFLDEGYVEINIDMYRGYFKKRNWQVIAWAELPKPYKEVDE